MKGRAKPIAAALIASALLTGCFEPSTRAERTRKDDSLTCEGVCPSTTTSTSTTTRPSGTTTTAPSTSTTTTRPPGVTTTTSPSGTTTSTTSTSTTTTTTSTTTTTMPVSGPLFYENITPITHRNCVGCHTAGGVAPFALDSLFYVRNRVNSIIPAINSRAMPPFGADNSGACNTFTNAQYLTPAEIATFAAWRDAGTPAGNPANAAPIPPPVALPSLDFTADMGATYTPRSDVVDDYRCFLIPYTIATERFLTAFQLQAGQPSRVHHAVLFQPASAEALAAAEAMDAAQAGLGYECFGGPGVAASTLALWTPGTQTTLYPPGTGIRVAGGRKLLLQIHYNSLAGVPLADRTRIHMTLPAAVTQGATWELRAKFDFVLPPGQADISATNTETLAGMVHGIYPHMHTAGKSIRVERVNGAEVSCMINVPRWDFHWQQAYFFTTPINLGAGQQLRLTCHWDTTGRTTTTRYGEGTDDEMCLYFAYVTPPVGSAVILSSITPATLSAAVSNSLVFSGSGFLPGAEMQFLAPSGATGALPLTFVSSNELRYGPIPGGSLMQGVYTIRVHNGGGVVTETRALVVGP